jgi:hypothetical protein
MKERSYINSRSIALARFAAADFGGVLPKRTANVGMVEAEGERPSSAFPVSIPRLGD